MSRVQFVFHTANGDRKFEFTREFPNFKSLQEWRNQTDDTYRRNYDFQVLTNLTPQSRKDSFKMCRGTELVSTDVESISKADKTCLKIEYSMRLTPHSRVWRIDFTPNPRIPPWKKKKWIRFWIKGNEEFWNHLMKGTQVPVTESSSQPNNNPWIPIDLPRRVTSTQFEFVQCVQYYNCCSSCTFLCYSGQSVLFCSRTKTLYQRALIIGSYRSTYTSIVESIVFNTSVLYMTLWYYSCTLCLRSVGPRLSQ